MTVDQHRERLFWLAYRMLGSATEAEDAVQEAYARYVATPGVDDAAAWLTTAVTNRCIDVLRSARRRRETYVGPWLPEPLVTQGLDPADVVGSAETLTLAFLVVLERLSPAERAAFVLHDVFGYGHDEIAGMLGRSRAAVRQLASRARRHVREGAPRFEVDPDRQRRAADAFLAACAGGDLSQVLDLLAPEVVFTSDGGGVVTAARFPVVGAERVARLLLGLTRTGARQGAVLTPVELNGEPGVVATVDDRVEVAMVLQVVDDRVAAVHAVRNPEKLGRVRPR